LHAAGQNLGDAAMGNMLNLQGIYVLLQLGWRQPVYDFHFRRPLANTEENYAAGVTIVPCQTTSKIG
jgi:hypothetical protein